MAGIRVSGLQANVTDKHLKVYFSNPKNGGGHIIKIYHPLPHASAVVLFDDRRVVQEVLKRNHQMSGKPVHISATPKQVFRRAVVEVEKSVSDFLGINPQLVDELQFIGEINVNFQYEKQRYLLDGAWYQIEWALHYLDTMLEAYQFDMDTDFQSRGHARNTQGRVATVERRSPTEFREESPPRSQQIKRPNIPLVRPAQQDEQPKSLPVTTDNKMSNFRKFAGNQSREMEEILPKANKNKNVLPVTSSTTSEARSTDSKLYGKTVRSNLNDEKENRYQTGRQNQRGTRLASRGAQNFSDDDGGWDTGPVRGAHASYKKTFEGQGDSDSENEASLAAAYDRKIAFSGDTNFDENKARPARAVPRMTKGIDVSSTDFGEAPLSFTFEVSGNLKVHVAMDDITKQTTDTLINPTTPELSNVYGVSRALSAATGYEMQMACRRYVEENGPLHYTNVMHTAAGGSLSEKVGFIIHAAGPSWSEEDSEHCTHLLVCTYINCLQYADQKLWVQSLATPLISAGAFGFPLDVCIGAFYDAVLLFSTRSSTKRHLKEIHLVCFDQDSAMATIMIVQSLLDCDSAESAVAATDRYWMRSSKYNFQAEKFGKSDGEKDGSDDDTSDDERKAEVNKVVKQERNIQARHVDEDKQNNDSEDSDTEKHSEKVDTALEKPAGKQADKNKNYTAEIEKTDTINDTDSEKEENSSPYVAVNIAEGKAGQKAKEASFSHDLGLKNVGNDEKDYSDSGESDDGGFKGKEDISNAPADIEMSIAESGKVETGSSQSEKLKLANVDRDDDFSDDDENSHVQEEEFRKVYEETEPESEHLGAGYTKPEEREEHNSDNELGDEVKQPVSERTDKEGDFKVSVGKSSLASDSEWSMIPGTDATKDANIPNDQDNGDETGEELYL